MSENGQHGNGTADAQVLRWSGRVLCADDLRRSLNGHRELVLPPRTLVTPLAAEHLRENGVRVVRQPSEPAPQPRTAWGITQQRPHALVTSAVQALAREGLALRPLPPAEDGSPDRWARAVAECVARGECVGGVVFCDDPGLVCCVANKLAGLRAAAVTTIGQAARATLSLGPNLLAVEMPGRTFFEVRQILRLACAAADGGCPPGVACTLAELDGHAHR